MSLISRRNFFQFGSSILATLGISKLKFLSQAENYGKVLAQSTPRKLALLVGINKYQKAPLRGCVNDTEMQRQLLIHRFGFNPKDIYILTDELATRQGILEAFEEHLIKQAKPGDVAVFHYSGHGSHVRDPNPIVKTSLMDGSGLSGTLVPIDSSFPNPDLGGVVDDIMGHTLFLLTSALKTENFTGILDSCFSGMTTRDFTVRSRAGGNKIEIAPQEKGDQEKWLSRLDMSKDEFVKGYQSGVAKGVVFASAKPFQTAKDVKILDFHAGIFSYLFTQYLWQETGTPKQAIAYTNKQIPATLKQNSFYEVKTGTKLDSQAIYLTENSYPVANAVVTEVKGNQAQVWLGGLEAKKISQLTNGAVFNVIYPQEKSRTKLIFQSRDGLVGIATFKGGVKPGFLLKPQN
ncbi:MAG: caspase family protein [Okeania sp. SIO2F4]|uniref:caspase family protein n=1 Tax=Okeania sp. SIO2F4 TaxID=2607790 RepID=UPI001429CE9D|nr:caspase family protein [Okeania sp. SIO2F4]NES07297.1 caspase family protein [Okeania sp. SIO2F4]